METDPQATDFSADWTSHHFEIWRRILARLVCERVAMLEVGSFEGRSALFFLDYLPLSRITCVDSFDGALFFHPDNSAYASQVRGAEDRFDRNMAPFEGRVEKLKGRSATILAALLEAGRTFDLIYIDGSHRSDDVLIDTALCWPMLKVGGVIIWDDYRYWHRDDGPAPAIDAFLAMQRRRLSVLHMRHQVIAERTSDSPADRAPSLRRKWRRFFATLGRAK